MLDMFTAESPCVVRTQISVRSVQFFVLPILHCVMRNADKNGRTKSFYSDLHSLSSYYKNVTLVVRVIDATAD
jgi:hypothetical protein